jgi:hypothetical protein
LDAEGITIVNRIRCFSFWYGLGNINVQTNVDKVAVTLNPFELMRQRQDDPSNQ